MKATRKKEYEAKRIRRIKEAKEVREFVPVERETISIRASDYFYERKFEFEINGVVKTCFIRIPSTYDITLQVDPETSISERYIKFVRMCPDLEKYEKYFIEKVS